MEDYGAGSIAHIIPAINLAGNTAVSTGRPSVASMSLGGAANQIFDDPVVKSINLGISLRSCRNSAANVTTSSPARSGGNPGVITIGTTTITDSFARFSKFQSNMDVLAPGQDVLSCGITSDAAQSRSGTSMSTHHVAGLAPLIMGQQGKLTLATLKQRIAALSTSGVISGVPALTANTLRNNGATFV